MKEYTPAYFKETLPDWKRKKDSFLVRHIHRPISFAMASLFCRCGLTANAVSTISIGIGILASACYLANDRWLYLLGAVMLNVWMIMDCSDGNIARSIKKERYGEFVDAASGYILISSVFICMGVAAFRNDGLIVKSGCGWMLLIGALAADCNAMGRLLYQKFVGQEASYEKNHETSLGRLRVIEDRIEKEIGIDGLLLPFAVVVSCMEWFDLFIIAYAVYYSLKLAGTLTVLLVKCFAANAGG